MNYEVDRPQIEQLLAQFGQVCLNWARDSLQLSQEQHFKNSGHPPSSPHPFGLFPGSFNPLHEAHRSIRSIAQDRLGMPIHFELAVKNADKPMIDSEAMYSRIDQFRSETSVWITSRATFAQKFEHLAPSWFVVGIDTLERIGQPRFYSGGEEELTGVLNHWHQRGLQFLVFGRRQDGNHIGLADVDVPPLLHELTSEIPETEFSMEMSSTQMRLDLNG